ncbi:MAG: hypothetical protein KF845_14110 [Cyclobacteriaceae bacterium]|nr:hypothetical protein [Cyclobacteriaceae bacterium]
MRKLLVMLLITAPLAAFAKIWIVDSNPGSTAKDFTTINAAHADASAGDTLYLIGSPVNYTNATLTITKRLVIIGPGYFLGENPNTQANLGTAFMGSGAFSISFAAGSEGSVITGVEFRGGFTVSSNNIVVKRNYFFNNSVSINASNVVFIQNYFGANVAVGPGHSNVLISNNYIASSISNAAGSMVEISNNIINSTVSANTATVQNNLIRHSGVNYFTGSVVRNNFAFAGSNLPAGNGNTLLPEANFNAGFINTASTDGRWQLSASSPFKGAGYNGEDCGIFGGLTPYVLSGLPPVPSIYSLTAPSVGEVNSGLQVQIKAKSNN